MSDSYTFILVPDAKSQCKRFTITMKALYTVGIVGVILAVVAGILFNTMWSDYKALSKKVNQVEILKKVSISRSDAIHRFEEEVTQLSNALAHIQHLNSRLMMLAGFNPEGGEQNLGLGGSEEEAQE
jgi:hypothetical protein